MTATAPAEQLVPEHASNAARDAFWDCLPDTYDDSDMAFLACYLEEFALPAAAPLIVAAELRRQADFYDLMVARRGTSRGTATANKAFTLVARQLRDRADKLDGGAV